MGDGACGQRGRNVGRGCIWLHLGVQVSVYGVETAAQPDTASAAGGDFAALLSTQSTEGASLHTPPPAHPPAHGPQQSALCPSCWLATGCWAVTAWHVGTLQGTIGTQVYKPRNRGPHRIACHTHRRGDTHGRNTGSSGTGPPKPLARVPAWLKRPVSGALGFAGKLATVINSRKGEEPDAPVTAQLAVKQVDPKPL